MNEIMVKDGVGIKVAKYVLSMREKFLVKLRLEGKNYAEIAREYERVYGKSVKWGSIKLWLNREHVREEILKELKKRSKVDNFDERLWKMIGVEVIEGEREMVGMQAFVWKEMGKASGFYEEDKVLGGVLDVSINFKQGDGRV